MAASPVSLTFSAIAPPGSSSSARGPQTCKAIVAATNKGAEAKDPQANERAAHAEIARLTTLLRGHQQAAGEAGNALARQIDEHRDEWRDSLDETHREAVLVRASAKRRGS